MILKDQVLAACEFKCNESLSNEDYAQALTNHVEHKVVPIMLALADVAEAAERSAELADDYADSFISRPIRDALPKLRKALNAK